jgi:hypothetical protein
MTKRRCGRQALLVMLWVFVTIGAIGLLVLVGWGVWWIPQTLYTYVVGLGYMERYSEVHD